MKRMFCGTVNYNAIRCTDGYIGCSILRYSACVQVYICNTLYVIYVRKDPGINIQYIYPFPVYNKDVAPGPCFKRNDLQVTQAIGS